MAFDTLPSIDAFNNAVSLIGKTISGGFAMGKFWAACPDSAGFLCNRSLNVLTTGIVLWPIPTQLFGVVITNQHATDKRYLKIYNKDSEPLAADTPVLTLGISAGQTVFVPIRLGLPMTAGIGVRATTGAADADAGVPGTNDVVVGVLFR